MTREPRFALDEGDPRDHASRSVTPACQLALPELIHLPWAAEWLSEAGACPVDTAPTDARDADGRS